MVGAWKGRVAGESGLMREKWNPGSEDGRWGALPMTRERKTEKPGLAGATGWVEEPYRAEPVAGFAGSAAGWMAGGRLVGPDAQWSQSRDGWVVAVYTRSPQRGPIVGRGCVLGPFGITVAGCVVGLRQKRIV